MKTLRFSHRIGAPASRVWATMIDPTAYRDWTSAFCEGSYFEGSSQAGQRIRFLAPNGDGMVAEIAVHRPNEFISIRHLGGIENGVEDTGSGRVKAWAPAYENYTFRPAAGGTEVIVDQDVLDEYQQYMLDTWPKALQRLQALCEAPQIAAD